MKKKTFLLGLTLSAVVLSGCGNAGGSSVATDSVSQPSLNPVGDTATQDPVNPVDQSSEIGSFPQVLLFNGIGISYSDWKSTESILQSMGLSYRLVNSSQLTSLSSTDLAKFKLMIVPGGNSNTINDSLSSATRLKVRQAVRESGVSYLGLCAGAFAAVGTDARSTTISYYGFSVALGDFLKHWYPNGNSSLVYSIPKISFADGTTRAIIWWDGPATPEWAGGVIARYPDGKPAMSQIMSGAGFVVLSGVHPEAPASWQYDTGTDPDGLDHAVAMKLIRAALNRQPLPVY